MLFKYFITALAIRSFLSFECNAQTTQKTIQEKFNQCCKDLTEHTVSAEYAKSHIGKAIFIDARSKEERSISIIPGAITIDKLNKNHKSSEIIVYCTIGYRSGKTTETLRSQGYAAHNLEGGILAWTWAQGPLLTPTGKKTHALHTWSDKWNLTPPNYSAKNH
ncbi:MAG: rhodanese-like domain-containing protein [Oligoflexales bacterium]